MRLRLTTRLSDAETWRRNRARDASLWSPMLRGYMRGVEDLREEIDRVTLLPSEIQRYNALMDLSVEPFLDAWVAGWEESQLKIIRSMVNATVTRVAKNLAKASVQVIDPEEYPLQQTERLALEYMRTRGAKLIASMRAEMKQHIRAVLSDAIEEGWDVRQMVRAIKNYAGLSPQYSRAVRNAEKRWIKEGLPYTDVERRVERYSEKLTRTRAETIARTETIAAKNQGHLISWKQLQSNGDLPERAQKRWIAAPAIACEICRTLHLEDPKPLNATYSTKFGEVTAPPAHPNCRCSLGVA